MNAIILVRQTTLLVAGLFVLAIGHDSSCPFAGAQEFPPTERTEVGTKWKVSGKVTTTSSRPISGVKVYVSRGAFYTPMSSNRYSDLQNPVTSSFSGKFEIDVQERHRLVFLKSGFAPLNAEIPDGSSLDVQLTTGRSISGTILLPSGEPATNAIVTPVLWLIPKPETQQYQPNPGDRGQAKFFIAGLPGFGDAWKVKTDGAGKFSLPHLPSEYRVGLSVKSEGWKEGVVYVRAKEDAAPPDFDNQVLVDNQFTYSIEPCSLLEIKATDESGNPASIERVSIYPINNTSNAFDFRRTEPFGRTPAIVSMHAQPTGSYALVEPVDSKNLLGVRLKLPPNDEIEIVEKEVEFPRGKPIRGRVTNRQTGEPIEGVRIKWAKFEKGHKLEEEATFPDLEIKTDKQGRFAVAVPDVDGIIGISGDIDGFCTMACNLGDRDRYTEFAQEAFDQFTFDLQQGQLDDLETIELQLQPSYRLDINVVNESGQPSPNCVLAWSRKNRVSIDHSGEHSGGGFRVSYGQQSFAATTDAQGHVLVPDFYNDAFFMAAAIFARDQPDRKPEYLDSISMYPITIQAFSIDGFKQGQAVVPLPDATTESNTIPVTIKLLPGGDVVGQILDSEGVGIAGLDVSARSGGNSFSQTGQLWKTKTRKDGMFKMQGLPAASKLHWSLDATRVKTRGSHGGIEIDTSRLVNGETLTAEPIVCEDYTVLAGDLPEIEIGGLSNEAALEILTAYIEDSIERIPESGKKPSGGSSGEPVPTYVQKVIAKAIPIIKELADREPGSDFELELLTKIPPHLLSGNHASLIFGNEVAKLESFCKERLLKNHADKENAQEQLIMAHLFSRHGPHRDQDKQWQNLYDASPFAETKAVAAYQSVVHFSSEIRTACYAKETQKSFERTFAEFDQQLKRVEEYAKDLDPKWEEIVGSSFKRNMRGLETQLQPRKKNQAQDPRKNNASQYPQQPKFDESRAAKTLKRIQSALEKIE